MKQLAIGIVCACGLAAAACAGSTGPTSPTTVGGGGGSMSPPMAASALTHHGGTALARPMAESAATGVARAIARCQGPVLQTLEEVFSSPSTPIAISDDGSVAMMNFSDARRTFTLGIAYLDNDGSGSLSCGDTVTSVGTT